MEPTEPEPSLNSPTPSGFTAWLKRIAWFLVGYIIILIVSLPYLIPPVPKTKVGWILLLVLGPPGCLLAEWIVERFTESWGESNVLLKGLKAAAIVAFFLLVMLIGVLFGT